MRQPRNKVQQELSSEELQYIIDSHKTTTVKQMSLYLRRDVSKIYKTMDDLGLPIFRLKPGKARKIRTVLSEFFNAESRQNWLV